MIEPQSMQEGASAWFTKLPTRLTLAVEATVVASPDPPATAPAAFEDIGCVDGVEGVEGVDVARVVSLG